MLNAPSVLLEGESGTGKTYSLRTIMESGMNLFYVGTENKFQKLADFPCEAQGSQGGFHYIHIPPGAEGWKQLKIAAQKITNSSYDDLTKMGAHAFGGKGGYPQMVELLEKCMNFKCERCGEDFGALNDLDPTANAVAIDSLTGVSMMSLTMMSGGKPTRHQGEWGIAMDNVERFILQATSNFGPLFILIAHIERETDEITGREKVMASTLGRKLAPRLPRFFDEVVLAIRDGAAFKWSNATTGVALRAGDLPLSTELKPTFAPIIDLIRKRNARTHRPERNTDTRAAV